MSAITPKSNLYQQFRNPVWIAYVLRFGQQL